MPKKFGPGFDVICRAPVFDSKSFLTNVVFDNFKQNYSSGTVSSNVNDNCGRNFVFKPHPIGFDMVGSINLYTSNCTNCDSNSYLSADKPNKAFLGWFGGCGDIVCTGFENYLVNDWTGTFFGTTGSIIPNVDNVVGIN